MKQTFFILFAILSFSFSVSAMNLKGTWSTPFSSIGASNIYKMQGTDNYIWFITDGAICRFTMNSNDILIFDQSSFDEPFQWDDLLLTVGDSNHVAIYDRDEPIDAWIYNGISWKKISAVDPCKSNGNCAFESLSDFSFDKKGNLWCIYRFDNDPERELFFYSDSGWKKFDLNSHSITPYAYAFDASGIVWIRSGVSPGNILYRVDPVQNIIHNYTSLDFNGFIKDIHGNIYLLGDTTVYSVSNNLAITEIPHGVNEIIFTAVFDTDGNLWYTLGDKTVGGASYRKLIKYNMNNKRIRWVNDSYDFSTILFTNNAGVYQYKPFDTDIRFYKDSDTNFTIISIDSIRCSQCSISPFVSLHYMFKKDGTFVYIMNGYKSGDYIVANKNGTCTSIPLPDNFTVDALHESTDGTLLAGLRPIANTVPRFDGTVVSNSTSAVSGLYRFDGTTWELQKGTDNISFTNIFQDSKGKIWSLFIDKIIRQTDSGWELIDNNNSNLPKFNLMNTLHSFKEDADGSLWAIINYDLVKTSDGYKWTIFNNNNSNFTDIPNSRLFINKYGKLQIVYIKPSENEAYSDIIRLLIAMKIGFLKRSIFRVN